MSFFTLITEWLSVLKKAEDKGSVVNSAFADCGTKNADDYYGQTDYPCMFFSVT